MSSSEILVTIQNNTDNMMATNVFNVEDYDWDGDSRPNTNLHERLIGPQSEIAEFSQVTSTTATSYNLGLTCSDGSYLELRVDHGKTATEGEAVAAEEICQVTGSVGAYRVETAVTGVEPMTLRVTVLDKEQS